jgi:hypothetical protein
MSSNITFQRAVRESVGLLILLSGGTGSGKTYSGMRLAQGIAGDKRFAVIDTENRRALHYADMFNFDVFEMDPPFRPGAYAEAIRAADAAGYPVIVVDSMSHEWVGEGGILEWQEEELKRMGGGDNNKMRSWVAPKTAHKRMVQDMLRVKAHVILCLRAEEKIDIITKQGGGTAIVPKVSLAGLDGWVPISEKTLPFEATCSFLLKADHPGVPLPIKLQEQHRVMFPDGKPIDEEAGKRVAEWAAGGEKKKELTLEEKRTVIVGYFTKKGVTETQILRYVEKTSVNDIGDDEIVKLKAAAQDIKDNLQTVDSIFAEPPAQSMETEAEQAASPEPHATLDDEGQRTNYIAAIDAYLEGKNALERKMFLKGKDPKELDMAELELLYIATVPEG